MSGWDRPLPTGTVTFLLTDVAGSTRMWEEHPDIAGHAIERHDQLIGTAVGERGGVLIKSKGEGDSTFSVFEDACDAVAATVELQRALGREPWLAGGEVRVRAALYTGAAELRDGDYHGIAPNRGGRLRAVAHGGQAVCAQATGELVRAAEPGRLPSDLSLRDLGLHRLRDLIRAERVFQLVHPELPVDFPPLRSLGVRHNLPARRTTFVGRAADRSAVERHLATSRLMTLTGVGGCGKTRLAAELASAQLQRFPDGVFFVDLAAISDDAVLAATVAAAVGFARLALGTGSGRPAAELIEYLSTREVLLVLDNCEHLIDACAELVDEILERCPDVTVLATSREALELQGEQTHPVRPLDVGHHSDSAVLFADRAALVRPGFTSSTAPVEVAEICRRLDGIPLAIELAAAQVAHLSPRQILERLDDRFRLLTGGRRRTRRQQTLRAALAWSHDLLGEEERTMFRRLGAFPAGFTPEAARAVCGEPEAEDLLRSLVAKSLVMTEDEGADRRFRLLETVRAYAEERLRETGEDALARDRHRDHFLDWVEAMPPSMTYLDPEGSIRRERDNLRAALAWSEEQGQRALVGRLASTMGRLWVADVAEGRRWLSSGLEAVDELDPEHRVRVLAVAAQVAVLAMEAFDGELARQAVAASGGRPGTWSSLAHALLCLNAGIRGFWTKEAQCAGEVEELGRQAVELATEPLGRNLAWFWLGQARVLIDDTDGAIDALGQGSVEAVPGGDMSPVALAMLAGMLHLGGRHDEAMAAASEVFERGKSFQDSGLWAWALYCSLPYALELGQRGRHAEAAAFVRDQLADSGAPLTPGVMTSVVVVLGALAVLRNDLEAAAVLLDRGGRAIVTEGIRTPVDMALYSHYLVKVQLTADEDAATRARQRAEDMELADALNLGLEVP